MMTLANREIASDTNLVHSVSEPVVSVAVNWADFLKRHDPVWERLPKIWMEGAFVGNGRLGAMIYQGDGEAEPGADVLAWTIGRSDLYDERGPDYKRAPWSDNCRVPIGRFHLCPVGKVKDGQLRIELWNGEACGTITTDRGSIRWRSWVQEGDAESGVIVIDLETDEGEKGTTWKWQPMKSVCPRKHSQDLDWEPNPDGHRMQVDNINVWVQPFQVGGDYATAWFEKKHGALCRTLYVAVGYGLHAGGSDNLAAQAIQSAAGQDIQALQDAHRRWWHAFYAKSFLSIPDARIESHYWIQMYKLASATRADTVVVDTCGPWLKCDTVWPACWWNLNVQLFHYPIPVANHRELNEPLIRLLQQELDNGNLIRNAPEGMRHDSAYFGNPTTVQNLLNADVYWNGKNLSGAARKAARLNHLPWICHTIWEDYRRSMDDALLRELLFPLTRRAYSFIFHFLEEGNDGKLHVKDIYSSEYGAADDANEALAMIQWGCGALLWMTDRLGIDDPEIPRWKDILDRLVEPPVDQYGLMIGSDTSFVVSHRHYSHLMYLVPFRMWDVGNPEKRKLAIRSLEHFLRQRGGLAGYSYTGGSSMYAFLGEGDKALHDLRLYLEYFDHPSTMYTEANPASPVMETPPSAARCVQDMLLQSHDVIRIFPAVPSEWQEAAFDKLLAEGAFEVSASRQGGKTRFVRIRSLAGEPCRVKTDLESPVRLTGKGQVKMTADAKGIITLDLARGEEAILVPDGASGSLTIKPLEINPEFCNYYGLKPSDAPLSRQALPFAQDQGA